MTTTDKIAPIHPEEVLMEDFIEGFGITQNKLAVSIGVPPRRINEIVHGKRGVSADTALRLARYFGTSAEFWINLQSRARPRTGRFGRADRGDHTAADRVTEADEVPLRAQRPPDAERMLGATRSSSPPSSVPGPRSSECSLMSVGASRVGFRGVGHPTAIDSPSSRPHTKQ